MKSQNLKNKNVVCKFVKLCVREDETKFLIFFFFCLNTFICDVNIVCHVLMIICQQYMI